MQLHRSNSQKTSVPLARQLCKRELESFLLGPALPRPGTSGTLYEDGGVMLLVRAESERKNIENAKFQAFVIDKISQRSI